MSTTITHVLRAPVVGGSELETLAITRHVTGVRHRVVFPRRFARWEPSIRTFFPPEVVIEEVDELEPALRRTTGPVHLQFPFVLVDAKVGHDTVLELTELPSDRTVFTVHAAVNVPVVERLHYLFHTEELAARFPDIGPERRTICPSLVAPDAAAPPRRTDGPLRILWVSRNEEGKFHDQVPWIVRQVLERLPGVTFRFVGRSGRFALPGDPRVSSIPCPAADLAAEYRAADLFWTFPHPLLEETWCRTVTEALGHGLACVVADWGAMRFQVRDGAGLAVHTAEDCVEALVALARDPARRRALGEVGRERARRWFEEARATLGALYGRLSRS